MISISNTHFFAAIGAFVLLMLATGSYFYMRYRQRERHPYGKWDTLLKRLGSLNHDQLALIATGVPSHSDQQDQEEHLLDPEQVWQLIGGMGGLEVVERNCTVLVDLVFYVQQWYPEALLVAEQLRLNAREVQWHIDRLKGAEKNGRLNTALPDYLQQAIAVYYRMTCAVLSLYEQANLPGLSDLQSAL